MKYEQLKLENQLCFPVYAASRLITREYQPHLERLGITYPQYLVMMVLWENDQISVNHITKKLLLNTNTITPLLKRMEVQGLLSRQRSDQDERQVIVRLTEAGKNLRAEAVEIPAQLANSLMSEKIEISELINLKNGLHKLIDYLSTKEVVS